MKGTILIGSKNVEMAANAASPFVYKQVFHEDLLLEINKMDMTSPDVNVFAQLAFIMTKQGEGLQIADLMKLTKNEFYAWLEEFEPLDIVRAIGDISGLYFGQTVAMSVPKNEGE